MSGHTPEEHYTRIGATETAHAHPCGCLLERNDDGSVSLYQCREHAAAPALAAALRGAESALILNMRTTPRGNMEYRQAEGVLSAARAALALVDGAGVALVHVNLPRGGNLCGADGPSAADINHVTCPECERLHDATPGRS